MHQIRLDTRVENRQAGVSSCHQVLNVSVEFLFVGVFFVILFKWNCKLNKAL